MEYPGLHTAPNGTADVSVDNTAALSFVLAMDADKSITAEFHRTLTLTQTGGNEDTLDPAPGVYTYPGDTEVPLEAAEVDGWAFRAGPARTRQTRPRTATIYSLTNEPKLQRLRDIRLHRCRGLRQRLRFHRRERHRKR